MLLVLLLSVLATLSILATGTEAIDWSDHSSVGADDASIGVNGDWEDGLAYFVGCEEFLSQTHVYLVTTGNMSYDEIAPGSSFQDSPDVDVQDGVVHVVWEDARDGDTDIYYSYLQDGKWSLAVEISNDAGTESQSYPAIVVVGKEVHVAWSQGDGRDYRIYYCHFDGTGWSKPVEVSPASTQEINQVQPVMAAFKDTVGMVWLESWPGNGSHMVYSELVKDAWSEPVQLSWSNSTVMQREQQLVGVVDHFELTYTNVSDKGTLVELMANPDGVWTPPVVVSGPDPGNGYSHPGLAYMDGHRMLAYRGAPTATVMIFYRHDDGQGWSDEAELPTGTTSSTTDPVVVGGDGEVYVTWRWREIMTAGISYVRGDIEVGPPVSTLEVGEAGQGYWLGEGPHALRWTATDDYYLENVTLLYRFSTDNSTWTDWTEIVTVEGLSGTLTTGEHSFALSEGGGHYQFQAVGTDARANAEVLAALPDAVCGRDATPPTGTISIEDGAMYTTSTTITLTLTFSDDVSGVAGLRVSNEAIGGDEPWEDPVPTLQWDLLPGSGTRTVYLQVMDAVGLVSEVFTDDIVLDTDLPTGSLALGTALPRVNRTTFPLQLVYEDATSTVDGVRFSNDGIWDSEEWQVPAPVLDWTVTSGDGEKTVYYQVRDAAGQLSQTYTLSVTLDTVAPYVESTDPADGDENVVWTKVIVIRFSEPMDAASTEYAISITHLEGDAIVPVAGDITWSPDGRMLTYTPSEPLLMDSVHTILVGPDATDLAGNPVGEEVTRSFTSLDMPRDGGDGGGDGFPWGVVVALLVVICLLGVVIAFLLMRRRPDTG